MYLFIYLKFNIVNLNRKTPALCCLRLRELNKELVMSGGSGLSTEVMKWRFHFSIFQGRCFVLPS